MNRSSLWLPIIAVIGVLCLGLGAYFLIREQTPIAQSELSTPTIQVFADRMWNNTGITLNKGDKVRISASGQVNIGAAGDGADKWVGPEGWGSTPQWYSTTRVPHRYVFLTDSLGALRAKIGDGQPFKVGRAHNFVASQSGALYLGVEDGNADEKGRMLTEAEANTHLYATNRVLLTVS